MISLSILITCLLDSVEILWGEVTSQSLVGVKGLREFGFSTSHIKLIKGSKELLHDHGISIIQLSNENLNHLPSSSNI